MRVETVSGPFGFFTRRWRRQTQLNVLFWRDMIVVGTLINIAAMVASLIVLGLKAGLPVAMLIFFAPLPYNVFLAAAVWRTSDLAGPKKAASARTGAVLWLVIATLL